MHLNAYLQLSTGVLISTTAAIIGINDDVSPKGIGDWNGPDQSYMGFGPHLVDWTHRQHGSGLPQDN